MSPQEQAEYEQLIITKGNEILASLNAEEYVTDVSTWQYDVTYMQIFAELFPEMSFDTMPVGQTEDEMAANIDAILDFIEESVPEIDIKILNGDMIV